MTRKRRVPSSESASPTLDCRSCGKRHRTITYEVCVDRLMPERTLQARVIARAKARGWKVAHAGRGWVGDAETGEGQFITPMAPGWPDLFLLNEKVPPHRLAIEFKREQGETSPEQDEWLELLNACGIPAVVVRPSDLREGRVNAILSGG